MTTIGAVFEKINSIAPMQNAMSFDNVGLLVGDTNAPVSKAIVALDVTEAVLEQAAAQGAQLIISHHPVIFQPIKRLHASSLPYQLAAKGIAVISAHTNYDLAEQGVNYQLAKALGLEKIQSYLIDSNSGLPEGLIGTLPTPMEAKEFAAYVKNVLHCGGVSYTIGNRPVKKVAVGCGAGSYLLFDAIAAGADGFVVGESKHHELLAAQQQGLTMVTAGHFSTELPAMQPLMEQLQEAFPTVDFSLAEQGDPVSYL